MIYLIESGVEMGWIVAAVGVVSTIFGMIITIIKLYNTQRSVLKSQIIAENDLKNEIDKLKTENDRFEKDLNKLDQKVGDSQKTILDKIDQIDQRIEKKLEGLTKMFVEAINSKG